MNELMNERIMNMKRIVMIIMAVALIALPTMAQDWQSTSSMHGTGSSYAPQVTEVGATGVSDMATTTEGYSPAKAPSGPRRSFDNNPDPGKTNDNSSPIGDAVLPLMLMAFAFGAYVTIRKRRQQMN
jgi:hypothetical protein